MTMTSLLVFGLLAAQEGIDAGKTVAVVLGRKITAGEIGLKTRVELAPAPRHRCDSDDPVSKLQALVWRDVARHYVEMNGLKATAEELRELRDWMRQTEEENRRRWAKDLEQIEKRLRTDEPADAERRKLETRKETLQSLLENDRRMAQEEAAHPEESRKAAEEIHAPMVEAAKVDLALYRSFGGVVAVTKFGQVPVGARAALLRKVAKESRLEFFDPVLEQRFWSSFDERPSLVAAPHEIDLSPFWKTSRR
jgi:hypothetical protein